MAPPSRRLPAPWTVTPFDGGYAVEDSSGVRLAYVYFAPESGSRPDLLSQEDARLVATGIAHLPDLMRAAGTPSPVPPPAERIAAADTPRPEPDAAPASPRPARPRLTTTIEHRGPEPAAPVRSRSTWRAALLPWVLPGSLMALGLVLLLLAFDDPATGRSREFTGLRKFLSLSR
ncbi:MAG: hypothetical protein U1E62_05625 [Alsobacter sp.]